MLASVLGILACLTKSTPQILPLRGKWFLLFLRCVRASEGQRLDVTILAWLQSLTKSVIL